MSNSEVRGTVLGPRVQSLEVVLNHNRFRWLGHVWCTPTHCLYRCTPFFKAGIGCRMVWGARSRTQRKTWETLTSGQVRVVRVRLSGWGSRDPPKQW